MSLALSTVLGIALMYGLPFVATLLLLRRQDRRR